MYVDDFIDEFYSFNINNWADSLLSILQLLSFPIHIEYTCGWKEFLYEKMKYIGVLNAADRRSLASCHEIAVFSMDKPYRKLKVISAMLTGNPRLRNEKAYDVYKFFRKVYGRHVLFVACFDRDIAFVGTAIDELRRSEVIISDWFGENTERETMWRILEIDFSLFSSKNIGMLYRDYLWAISRPYIKYRESKMYLIYGCGYIETYESFADDTDSDAVVPITRIDQEETIRKNVEYYLELYGDDYFIDESVIEDDLIDEFDQDEAEFEWTLLEMELAKEDIQKDDDYEEDYDDLDQEIDERTEDITDDISGMNPEEMLSYIQKGRI